MSTQPRSQAKYTYVFKVRAEDSNSPGFDGASRDDIQRFVNASLGMLTGGCEMCEFARRNNSPALFCEKNKSPVNWGAPRCEYFIPSVAQPPKLLM